MEPLAVVTRGDNIESVHSGHICVTDSSGKILYNLGDYKTNTFFRSSAKPLQAIPLIESGAAEALNFSLEEIAIACASHSGQLYHQDVVKGILKRLKFNIENLHCGVMKPFNVDEDHRVMKERESYTELHNCCSGKHAGMLALAKFKSYDTDTYEKLENPVQQEIMKIISEFAEEDINNIKNGIDGCGVPTFLLPIHKMALSYAKIAKYSQDEECLHHKACRTVFEAMTQYPEMVSGDNEFCTELMHATGGKLIGKVGSEGVYCVAIRESSIGFCVKITDGRERAVHPVVIEVLKQLEY